MFVSRFNDLSANQTPDEVLASLGEPDHDEDTIMPLGSAVGLQECFAHKIAAEQPVKQWIYSRDDMDHYVWFAWVGEEWKLSARLSLPRESA